jgi:hypothetical protein
MTNSDQKHEDELEKKISEAEMEAQLAKDSGKDAGSSFEAIPVESPEKPPAEAKEKKGLTKARVIWRRILVWLVVIALAFAGGFFVDTLLRYQPQQALTASLASDLEQSQGKVSDLEAEIERLGAFEEQNTALNEQITQMNTHLTLLSARAAVADTALALEQERLADAKLALGKVSSTLDNLKDQVTEDQVDVVDNMIQRQRLITVELLTDVDVAKTDLGVLASKLSTLENTLFAAP